MLCVKSRAGFTCIAVIILLQFSGAAAAEAWQLALQTPVVPGDPAQIFSLEGRLESRLSISAAGERSKDSGEANAQEREAAWDRQLRSFYLSRNGAPVWVSERGWSDCARAAILELKDAESWGLQSTAFAIPPLYESSASNDDLADAEIGLSRAVVKYAFHARGGRIAPSSLSLWLDSAAEEVFASQVMIDVISNDDAGAALRDMHPRSEAFKLLRQALNQTRHDIHHPKGRDPSEVMAPGPLVKLNAWHPDILILRRRLKVAAEPGFESQFDKQLASALHDALRAARIKSRWGRFDDRGREFFNRPPPPPEKSDIDRIIANMERWRWLPRDLGKIHIWNNLPEYLTRIFKDGEMVHEERIIVGQPDTQTPVFSDVMRQVVFQPEWGVPPSIKVNDLLPKLQAGDYSILDRRDMRILGLSGRELHPKRFKWDKVDIRDIGIYQRSGGGNPLGRVKFLFPNKFHVYMHDTNNPSLFKAGERSFSHGCIRVRNPEKLAEILLGIDQGWNAEQVKKYMDNRRKPNNKVDLERPIPVHNVYFTLVPGDGHTLVSLDDIYGHDKRITQVLAGVSPAKIAANDPARFQQLELEEAAPPAVRKAKAKERARAAAND